jgi:hypothetical protein
MRAKGTAEGSLTLRVLDQDGPLLKLEKSWTAVYRAQLTREK